MTMSSRARLRSVILAGIPRISPFNGPRVNTTIAAAMLAAAMTPSSGLRRRRLSASGGLVTPVRRSVRSKPAATRSRYGETRKEIVSAVWQQPAPGQNPIGRLEERLRPRAEIESLIWLAPHPEQLVYRLVLDEHRQERQARNQPGREVRAA